MLLTELKQTSIKSTVKIKRISDISRNENAFNNAKLTYEKALNKSGCTETFLYIKYSDQNINNREAKKKT